MVDFTTTKWDTAFDMAEWKTSVDENILLLKERISCLEQKNHSPKEKWLPPGKSMVCPPTDKPPSRSSSLHEIQDPLKTLRTDSFAVADYEGSGSCLSTFITLVKSKRHAQVQFVWLLSCVLTFLFYGVSTFNTAKINEQSEFKPEWKHHVTDYESELENYEMPSIYFLWYIRVDNITMDEVNSEDLLTQILESQDNFNNSVIQHSVYRNYTNVVLDVVVSSFSFDVIQLGSDVGFMVSIKLDVNIKPSLGVWELTLLVDMDALSLNSTVSLVSFFLNLNRDESAYSGGQPIGLSWNEVGNNEEVNIFLFEYSEIVTHKYNSDDKYYDFEVTWAQVSTALDFLSDYWGVVAKSSDILLLFKPDLEVEHWAQYVAFGYGTWFTGMGGLFFSHDRNILLDFVLHGNVFW